MSGGTYRYDVEELHAVSAGLHALAADFESASANRQDVDGALGYGDLRGAVRAFVDNWEHERGKQLEAIAGSASVLAEILDSYVEYDAASAEQLRADCAPS